MNRTQTRMSARITTRTTLAQIVEWMREDGFAPADLATAKQIKAAAAVGCLLWDASRLTTTDRSRLDLRSAESEVAS